MAQEYYVSFRQGQGRKMLCSSFNVKPYWMPNNAGSTSRLGASSHDIHFCHGDLTGVVSAAMQSVTAAGLHYTALLLQQLPGSELSQFLAV